MTINYNARLKGFTIIELLVVATIIGLIAAIIIAMVSNPRQKSSDAAIKQNLNTIRSQAELFYISNNNTYGSVMVFSDCDLATLLSGSLFLDPTIKEAIAAVKKANGGNAVKCASGDITGKGTAGSWAVSSPLTEDINNGKFWCADFTSASGLSEGAAGGGDAEAYCQF